MKNQIISIDVEIEELEPKIAPDGGETVVGLIAPIKHPKR